MVLDFLVYAVTPLQLLSPCRNCRDDLPVQEMTSVRLKRIYHLFSSANSVFASSKQASDMHSPSIILPCVPQQSCNHFLDFTSYFEAARFKLSNRVRMNNAQQDFTDFLLGTDLCSGQRLHAPLFIDPEDHMATFWQKDLNNFVPLL